MDPQPCALPFFWLIPHYIYYTRIHTNELFSSIFTALCHESWHDSGCYIHRFSNSTWNEIKKQYSACNTLYSVRQWSAMHFQLQDVEQRCLFSSHFLCSWLTSSSQLANRPPPCQAFYPYLPTTSRQRKLFNSGICKNMHYWSILCDAEEYVNCLATKQPQ